MNRAAKSIGRKTPLVTRVGQLIHVLLSPSGETSTPIDLTAGNTVELNGKQPTHWFVVTR